MLACGAGQHRDFMRIRQARQSDIAAAAQLWFERMSLLRETDTSRVLAQDAIQAWANQAHLWIKSNEYAFFVGEIHGEIVGLLIVSMRENPSWLLPRQLGVIVEMAVDLHQAHPGLSGALLAQAKAWLKTHGVRLLEIQAPARYPVEEAFWRAQGARTRSSNMWLSL